MKKQAGYSSSTSRLLITLLLSSSFILSIFLLATTIFLFINQYDDFCHLLLSKLGKPEKENLFKSSFLSKEKYSILQIALLVTSFMSLLFSFAFLKKRTQAQERLTPVLKRTNTIFIDQRRFINEIKPIRFYFFTFLVLQFIFFSCCAFTFPISYDEAWTYLNFTNKSILSSATYYPAPNNHVLFSILTNITNILPIDDPKIKMRMINVFLSILSSYIFFKLLCKFYSQKISLFTTALFTFSYPVALYSMQARGYGMLLLFSLTAIYSSISYLEFPSKKYMIIYLIAIIAGFYTIPTFLYPFIAMQLFICWNCFSNKKLGLFKNFVFVNCIGGCMVFILYAPIIFINGLQAITNNSYVKSISLTQVMHQLPEHFTYSLNWLLGVNKGGVVMVALIILSLCYTLINKNMENGLKNASQCMLLLLLSPPVMLIFQRVVPFERTWTYLTIPVFFGLGAMLTQLLQYFQNVRFESKLIYPIVLLLVITLFIINFPSSYKEKHPIDYQADKLFTKENIQGLHTVASNEILLTDLLTYKITILNKNIPVKILGIDTTTAIYADALVLNNNIVTPIKNLTDYTFIGKNEYLQLYLKKVIPNE